ncbi:syntaxin-8 [Penaeus vannamei]|uniref:syntaxin-8 n=1 Tax=Penaeus vannamei TaxID=6689 RepID=UPI00387F6463
MPVPYTDSEDSWLVDYGHTQQLVREVTEGTVQRRQLSVGQPQHALLSNQLRAKIPKAEKQVSHLTRRLNEWSLRDLTAWERERRERLCETLQSALKKARMDFREGRTSGGMMGVSSGVGSSGWGVEEEEEGGAIGHTPTHQLRQQQQRIMQDQNSGLEALSKVISQQKRIASAIGTEVEDQNQLIDDITDRTTHAQTRLVDETDNIFTVTRKTRTWPYWLVITLLFVAIIVVVVW